MTIYTKLDYKILRYIIRNREDKTKGYSRANGTTIKEVIELTNLSEGKVRNTISKFVKDGFLRYGISEGRTRTYCITEEGLRELQDIYMVDLEEADE